MSVSMWLLILMTMLGSIYGYEDVDA